MILLYANQPLEKFQGRYFTQNQNFVDFLARLAAFSPEFLLAVPCWERAEEEVAGLIEVPIPSRLLEVKAYDGHWGAIRASFRNLPRLLAAIRVSRKRQERVVVGGPGPNSMLFLLSLLAPRTVRFAFFIRGDTVETLRQIYAGRRLGGWFAPWLAGRFQRRIQKLLQQGRAWVFPYGSKLAERYRPWGEAVYPIAPLIDRDVLAPYRPPRFKEDGPRRFLFIGRFSAEKGILRLLEALVEVREQGYDAELTLVGYGPQEGAIRDAVERWGLTGVVRLQGFVPHGQPLMEVIEAHDVLCLPSRTEGTPRVVVEAFARSVPVLATPVGSIPFMFPNSVVLTEGLEPKDLSVKMAWCMDHPEELKAMIEKGWQRVEDYLIDTYVQDIAERLRAFSGVSQGT
ncbi:hypothetical protein AN478_11995 [Thiohalorhabdus denitrificans]|uniref:Glycosyltransferase involved in cell wall bisynthesis n=1 Tax=Thiohalorhabdus denitrificans TaxID=381306 RepID=A0A0P9C282_9GAMM|nr:glycosyltransferase [Thiohalorhabdus denitrificans]KPV39038.1 hypothetical protein AN478_11995 [Thiohalorhabdus denitrificans]SCX79335.1 Glycosyltransferase involved in cell wall bisynthesis [Thiohalorhabdus denitrificans]